MATETKWIMIGLALMMFSAFGGMALEQHGKSQCRIEAIKAGVEADKINAACGLK